MLWQTSRQISNGPILSGIIMSSITVATWEQLASAFYQHGWVWLPHFLSPALTAALCDDLQQQQLRSAGVGRQQDHLQNQQIRRDQTAWLDGSSAGCSRPSAGSSLAWR